MISANRYIFLSKEVLIFNYPINTVRSSTLVRIVKLHQIHNLNFEKRFYCSSMLVIQRSLKRKRNYREK